MNIFYLQNRWILEGRILFYYGMRNVPDLLRNKITLSKKQAEIVASLPKSLSPNEKKVLGYLLNKQIVLDTQLKKIPSCLSEARFCKKCCANDFIIPGLEFDDNGLCPMCQTAGDTEKLKSVLPILEEIAPCKHSRFDIAVFYTGGKDSTYLLYYLAKVKKLRVLALTWEIPFMSASARQSIEGAKRRFTNVEFIMRSLSEDVLKQIYRRLYKLSGNVCACPSLAYVLFYPELVANRVPYFVAGNEPVQMLGLYYNHIAPSLAYNFAENKFLNFIIGVGRVLTLRPPLKKGQFQALATMKQLAYGDNILKKASGYTNALVSNVVEAIHQVPELLPPLKKAIRSSSRRGNIPAFVHVDFNATCGGKYDWNEIKELLIRECDWVPPQNDKKALHTSCQLEKCKDYTQFVRFYHCQSKMLPFSAIEFSLASRNNGRTREDMLVEMEQCLGFSMTEPCECNIMKRYLGAL